MRTRSSSNLVGNSSFNPTTSNPKRHNRRRSNSRVEPFALEESLVVTMVDQHTMAELLRAPTEGYAEAIVVPPILAEYFELKHSLINMMTSDQFFGLEKDNPHDHIRWFNKITSTIKYKDVPNHAIKLMLFPFSLAGAARRTTNLRNEISNFQQKFDESFHEAWDRYKDLLRACPHHGFTYRNFTTKYFYNALYPSDQDSLDSACPVAISWKEVLKIDGNSSSSDIAKLTHAVNHQTSVVTTAMTTILKQFQATPPPASVKAVEEICVTCGGPHPYYQCLAADGNTFLEYRDNIQGYVAAATGNYNQGTGSLPSNTIANSKGELKAITTRSALVLDGPTIPMPYAFINPEEDERVEETLTDPDHSEYTIKVPPPQVQKAKHLSQRNFVIHQRDPRYPHIPYPSRMNQEKQKEKDEVQKSTKFCKFHISHADFVIVDYESDLVVPHLGRPILRTLVALIDVPGEEMILHDGNERLILNMRNDTSSYSNEPHQESINMIDVYNVSHEEICEDLFATNHLSGNPTSSSFSSHTDLTSPEVNDEIFDSEEDIIENLLNLDKTKDLPSYHDNQSSGNPTPISELETKSSSSSPTLISLEESDLIWEEFEAYLASDSFPPRNSNPSSLLPPFHNSLSGSTTSSSPSLHISETSDYFLEEFADELTHITFLPGNNDLTFDAESDLRELKYLLNHDPIKDMDSILEDSVEEISLDDNLDDTISEMFTDEHALDYSSRPFWDDYDDDLFDHKTVNDDTYNDPFDFKEEKIKDSKILIDELDPP
ncbi:hypothetical protein Tco_0526769 [Tanacetum coccineum]